MIRWKCLEIQKVTVTPTAMWEVLVIVDEAGGAAFWVDNAPVGGRP